MRAENLGERLLITYAQNFEDVMLQRLFDGRRDGFYVDVGAGDPEKFSVTKWFYDLGWSGINVEPNAIFLQRLVSARRRDVNLGVGAGSARGIAEFAEALVGELSTFDLSGQADTGADAPAIRRVQVMTLNDIIEKHGAGRSIDFLKIDVEGWELEVLRGLDLRRFRPRVLLIESTLPNTRVASSQKWEPLVVGQSYSLVHFDGLNNFYLADEALELRERFALPPGVFDEITPVELVRLAHVRATITHLMRAAADLRAAMTGSAAKGEALRQALDIDAAVRTVDRAARAFRSSPKLLGWAAKTAFDRATASVRGRSR
jgi:FkbM family methyltransferase